MSLTTVTLTGTLPGAAGATAKFTPSGWRSDSPDRLLLPPLPDPVTLDEDGSFAVPLLATDSTGVLPAGWTWQVTFSGIPGLLPYSLSILLPAAGAPLVGGIPTRDITDPATGPVLPAGEMAAFAQLGGDLAGRPAQVTGIQGTPVAAPTGIPEQFLNAQGNWAVPPGVGVIDGGTPGTSAGAGIDGGGPAVDWAPDTVIDGGRP